VISGGILTSERVERRLAAVLAADVAGYSRLMGRDEEGTLAQLKSLRKALVDPTITAHRGRIVKTTGDGMLVEFASAVDAARCAMEVQRGMARQNAETPQDVRIEFRIGIHVGDIIIDDNDIFGDGVNIAARLEGIAEPGGVCISDDAQRQVRGKVDIAFEDMGPQTLKNIAEPMRVWQMRLEGEASSTAPAKPSVEPAPSLALPDKPSIAVLPFQNMSGDPEQEYFADGMVEDIITALSHFKSLFVIARNSSFTYKGKAVDIKQVGRELGVRYVLEGSVRKAGGKVRITGQLIEAATGAHLWADKFDGALEDVFDLQDRVTSSVVGLIAPRIEQMEIERAARKPTGNLAAYDYYLRGLSSYNQWTKVGNEDALRLLRKAVELDPKFAAAVAWIAGCYNQRRGQGWIVDPKKEGSEAIDIARRSLEVGRDDASVLAASAFTLAYFAGEIDAAKSLADRSLQLNPNYALAWGLSGWIRIYEGYPDIAIEHFLKALQLNPLDTHNFVMTSGLAFAHFFAERSEEAHRWAERALVDSPNNLVTLRILAASAGEQEKARATGRRMLELNPAERISATPIFSLLRRPEDRTRWQTALRLAGLPE
jgi:TolB-like protein/class 3 adenylate cyclase